VVEKVRTEADYFKRNDDRMRYPKFRQQHLFVGSGVIAAGCKNRDRQAAQTIWNVPDSSGREGDHRSAMLLPSQRPLRRLLGGASGGVISTSKSPTRARRLFTTANPRNRISSFPSATPFLVRETGTVG
jgi:hypothetical protein